MNKTKCLFSQAELLQPLCPTYFSNKMVRFSKLTLLPPGVCTFYTYIQIYGNYCDYVKNQNLSPIPVES